MFRRFSEWLLFSLLVSLVPFWISGVVSGVTGKPLPWICMLRTGELLLITFGLAGTGIGEIFSKRRLSFSLRPAARRDRFETFALYCTFIFMGVVTFTAISYASRLTVEMTHPVPVPNTSNDFVLYESLILFACTALSGAAWSALARE